MLDWTLFIVLNIITTDLVGDANDVANKLSDSIFKALYTGHQVCLQKLIGLCQNHYLDGVKRLGLPGRGFAARTP